MAAIASVEAEVLATERLINVIVTVRDTDGAVGVGETWWGISDVTDPVRWASPMCAVINDLLAPRLIGRESSEIERLWSELADWGYRYGDQGIFLMGLSGVDLALWDLLGKRFDQPVASLLGGCVFDSIPAYASLPWLRDGQRVLDETTRAVEAGFSAVKLHEIDPEFTVMLRKEFGDGLAIMIDVNGHFDPVEAIEHGRRLSDLGVLWFEEPVSPMRDHRAISRVSEAIDCDLAGGENEYTLDDFSRLLATGALTYLQPEITKIGGLTAAKRVGALAELHNVALCPHNFRLGPSLYASVAWAFTSPASKWIEIPWMPAEHKFSFPARLPPMLDGNILPLSEPGLGVLRLTDN